MKKLLSFISLVLLAASIGLCADQDVKVAGKWQLTIDTPHGSITGPMKVQQEGGKLAATFESEHMGSMSLTGSVEASKVSFSMKTPDNGNFAFTGAVEGDKMSGKTSLGGAWSASR